MRLALEQFLAADDVDLIVKLASRKGIIGSYWGMGQVMALLDNFPVAEKDRINLNAHSEQGGVSVIPEDQTGENYCTRLVPVWSIESGWLEAKQPHAPKT